MILLCALDESPRSVAATLDEVQRVSEQPTGFDRGAVHQALRNLVEQGKIRLEHSQGQDDDSAVVQLTEVGRKTLNESIQLQWFVSHSWKLTAGQR